MASNGTADPGFLPPPHSPLPPPIATIKTMTEQHTTNPKRARSEGLDRTSLDQEEIDRRHHSDSDAYAKSRSKKGRPSPKQPSENDLRAPLPMQVQVPMHRQQMQSGALGTSWDPKSLLNPKSLSSSSPSPVLTSRTNTPKPAVNGTGLTKASSQVFQFSTPEDDLTILPQAPNGQSAGQSSDGGGPGAGAMIERINKVEGRTFLPSPKRRKTVDDYQVVVPDSDLKPMTSAARSSSSGTLAGYVRDREKQLGGVNSTNRLAPPQSAQTVDLTDNDNDVEMITDPSLQEVCFGQLDATQVSVNCHLVPVPRPGSMNLGGDMFWPPVKTVLKRKVNDQTATIMVYDHTREVFGRLDPRTSSGLCRLLDSAVLQLRTDCRIPSRKRLPDEVPGQPISRSYKIEIVLYGRLRFVNTVGKVLKENGLRLQTPALVNRGIQVVNPHANEPSVNFTTPRPAPGSSGNAYSAPPTVRTVEEVRSDVLGVFDSIKSEELPQTEPDSMIVTELLPHQKQGLYFMLARENPDENDALQRKHMGTLWQKKVLHGGQVAFNNVVTGQSEFKKPPNTLGGILADMMGLGKTLSVLALITASKDKAREWAARVPEQPVNHHEKRKTNMSRFHAPAPEPLGLTRLLRNAKTTLLVCPLSTVANWEEQVKSHVAPNGLSYHVYHGQNRIKNPELLSNFDLVITTYGSVSSELTARNKRKAQSFPLEEIGWFRIVLDEAHMIREQSTLQFKAICRLQASRRWAVTGTPVQNRLDDLAALLAFLRLRPFDDRNKFNHFIVMPFKAADPEIIPKLRTLVDTITLRRLKDKIHLPPRTDHVIKLRFTTEERQLYDLFARNAKDRVQVLTSGRERILGGKTYIHILQSILRLRLICAHGRDLLSDDDLKAVQGMSQDSAIELDSDDEAADSGRPSLPDDKAYEMFDLMKETNNDICVMCQRKLGSNETADMELQSEKGEDILGYMTPCFHLYCPRCVGQFRDDDRGVTHNSGQLGDCPICNMSIKFACAELRHTRADVEHEDATGGGRGGGGGGSGSSGRFAAGGAQASSSSSYYGRHHHHGGTVTGINKNVESYNGPHTKTRALVEDLLATKAESDLCPDEPPVKSVVFSGWTSHLDLIQLALDHAGIRYTRLDGKMSRNARTQAMDAFRDDPAVHVILVSIMAGGLGLNLTAGSRVYVMEPQYNPAAEAQAVDRVHRLGQKRAVRTVRYIMEDSFEEQMVALQDMKIKLASLSMDRGDRTMDKREAARQRLIDLKALFK